MEFLYDSLVQINDTRPASHWVVRKRSGDSVEAKMSFPAAGPHICTMRALFARCVQLCVFKSYTRIGMLPHSGPAVDTDFYNLFRGFPCTKEKADVPAEHPTVARVDKHILRLCGEDERLAKYVKLWPARLLQDPAGARAPALVFVSEQGVGKSAFWDWVSRYLVGGRHAYTARSVKDVLGASNDHLQNKVLVVIDEAEGLGGDRATSSALKSLVTARELNVNAKHASQFTVDFFASFVLLLSERPPCVESGDRRFVLIESACKADPEYEAAALFTEESGAVYFQHLAHLEWSRAELAAIPPTRARSEAQMQNASAQPLAFLLDVVHGEFNPGDWGDDEAPLGSDVDSDAKAAVPDPDGGSEEAHSDSESDAGAAAPAPRPIIRRAINVSAADLFKQFRIWARENRNAAASAASSVTFGRDLGRLGLVARQGTRGNSRGKMVYSLTAERILEAKAKYHGED